MKCIKCVYFPCMRLECAPDSNCDFFKNIVAAEIESIDSRVFIDPININERRCGAWKKKN